MEFWVAGWLWGGFGEDMVVVGKHFTFLLVVV